MRNWLSAITVCAALLVGQEAHAQFANKSIGLGVGYMSLNFDEGAIKGAIPIGLDGSLYIENGFDLVAHAYAMLLSGIDPATGSTRQFVGVFGSAGIRYLFSEESLRPYVGADLGYFQTFGIDNTINRVGISPNGGLDYFVADTVSIGARGQFTLYLMLNQPAATSLGLHGNVSAWF